ncbi:MAG: FixH family protein [Verrucomicrobia bacterium]|jgi:hypothetical protein|nr:FixH family protein [Verrucomicrobiota bacterium]
MTEQTKTKSFNPWPWAIVAAFLLFGAGTATLIIISTWQPAELVSNDYYEEELRYQEQMDRHARTRTEAPSASLRYDASQDCVLLSLPAEHVARQPVGRIQFYRPAAARDDHTVKLIPNAEGRQTIPTASLARGRWQVRVVWTVEGREYGLEEKLVLAPPKS